MKLYAPLYLEVVPVACFGGERYNPYFNLKADFHFPLKKAEP